MAIVVLLLGVAFSLPVIVIITLSSLAALPYIAETLICSLVLFLTIALIVVFVILLLWGFLFGDIKEGFKPADWMKWVLGILIGIGVILATVGLSGIGGSLFTRWLSSGG